MTDVPASGEAAPGPWMSWIGVRVVVVIVPWPWPSVTVAPVTLVTLTKNVSFGSAVVSPLTRTLKVWVDVPGGDGLADKRYRDDVIHREIGLGPCRRRHQQRRTHCYPGE